MSDTILDQLAAAGGYMWGAMAMHEELDIHANPESMIRDAFNEWCESDGAKTLFAMIKRDFILALHAEAVAEGFDAPPWDKFDADPDPKYGIREDYDIDLSKPSERLDGDI